MACSLRAPCGNSLIRMVEGADFAVVECVNGHAFRLGAPPPPAKPSPLDVVATAHRKPAAANRAKRHAPKIARASVRAKILARMIALGKASRA